MAVVEERYVAPRVNVVERENEVVIEAELPGVSREQAEIEVREGTLYLKAHARAIGGGGTEGAYRVQERPGASYYRSFKLGDTIDPAKIEARLQDGVLTLTLAKSDKFKPRAIVVN